MKVTAIMSNAMWYAHCVSLTLSLHLHDFSFPIFTELAAAADTN